MGSRKGVMKIAAKRLGLSLDDYTAKIAAGEKHCTKCKQWKLITQFNVDRNRGDGLSAKCQACCRRTMAPGKKERAAKRTQGIEWCRGCKAWVAVTPASRGRGACQACLNRERRESYASNPDFRHNLRQHVYNRNRNVDDVPPMGAHFLTTMFDGMCAYCGSPATTWDHIVPVSKGGKTTPGNILPACKPCNSSKGNRDVWEWLEHKSYPLTDLLSDRLVFAEVSLYG